MQLQDKQALELQHNVIPNHCRKIHLIAICGTGMGALAAMLKDLGYEVSGSDQKVYPPMSTFLAAKGILVNNGFRLENISADIDLVVVGNAVRRDNPEAVATMQKRLPFCSMPQAVNHFIAAGKKALVMTGTHGKTTTASLAAWVLHVAGLDPSFMIGGILKNFNSNYRLGQGDYLVLEGDEYDTAFFDKGPKFLHYPAHMAVLTSIEFDHADIFANLDQVKQAFEAYLQLLPQDCRLLAYDADANISHLLEDKVCRVQRYGQQDTSAWRLGNCTIRAPWTYFEVLKNGALFGRFTTRLQGQHNLLNALAVIALADALKIPTERMTQALKSFENAKRRQEVRGVKNGITVIDDFAHHPTAVRETINALKPFYPLGRLIAVFEPRTNSSMRSIFQQVYPYAFDQADIICIRQPPLLSKIPPEDRFSSQRLVDDLQQRGKNAHFFPDTETIIAFLAGEAQPQDAILIMSNGGFDNIHEKLLQRL